MPRLIAFLRAINVGGHTVKMDALRGHFVDLGFTDVETFIRTDAEVAAMACYKPFKESELRNAGALNVGFLAAPIGAAATKALMAMKTDIDDFHVHGREVYWLCRKKQSESTISNVRFEKMLRMHVTFRGVNTVARLAAKYGFSPGVPIQISRSS